MEYLRTAIERFGPVRYRLISHEPALTPLEAQRALGIPLCQIVKTLPLIEQQTDRLFVVALPADRMLVWKRVDQAARLRRGALRIASLEELRLVTGRDHRVISLFGNPEFSVIFARELLSYSAVYCNLGTPTNSLATRPRDLLRITNGKLGTVCRPR